MEAEQLEQFEELGRRAVACKHWRWMPGMRTSEGWRVIRGSTESRCMAYDENPENWQVADNYIQDGTLPDLSDPATLGCLLALVREAWEPHRGRDPICSTMQWAGMWGVGARCGAEGFAAIVLPTQPTEAAALVAALEAAP